ncbi:alpha-glucosidase [Opitutaceae bacterium EW11]|nr:alpha-glucosidase [Opitutaceae bacterium EW11]
MHTLKRTPLRHALAAAAFTCLATLMAAANPNKTSIASPDHRLRVDVSLKPDGSPVYTVARDKRPVLDESNLGLVRADADFSKGLSVVSVSAAESVTDRYEILTAKRRVNTYQAERRVLHLATADGKKLDLEFQVSNDGFAFRYLFPETDAARHTLKDELSSFHFQPGTLAWMQPIAVAKQGWCQANPSYEEYYSKGVPVGTVSPTGAGWIYPALFQSGDSWILVSEGSLPRGFCGSRLRAESPDGNYRVGFADPREIVPGGAANPESTLPWTTPWRLVVVGSLKTVAESTLGIDLAEKPAAGAAAMAEPGKASWSWPLLGDPSTTFDVQKRFIDYAVEMGWRYTLIDALWDTQIGYDKVKELADYARTKGVKILVWYNSAGSWNTTPQTPRDRLLTHESRIQEFDRLKAMGVAGLKIDFFGGDGSSMISYYRDILDDAAPYGFALNFHGATLPRGWQRTYPNLMTTEAIRGLEYVTFEQANADQEPTHAALLPFTRNVFDPMDFTPVVLDKLPHTERKTTSGFELALSVLFTSGIQHYAEIPEGMAKAPDYVRDFLRHVPSVWDDIRFIDGFPGKFVVLARRAGDTWYLCGINADDTARKVVLPLRKLGFSGSGSLIVDGGQGNLSFRQETVSAAGKPVELTLEPQGGFVMTLGK